MSSLQEKAKRYLSDDPEHFTMDARINQERVNTMEMSTLAVGRLEDGSVQLVRVIKYASNQQAGERWVFSFQQIGAGVYTTVSPDLPSLEFSLNGLNVKDRVASLWSLEVTNDRESYKFAYDVKVKKDDKEETETRFLTLTARELSEGLREYVLFLLTEGQTLDMEAESKALKARTDKRQQDAQDNELLSREAKRLPGRGIQRGNYVGRPH